MPIKLPVKFAFAVFVSFCLFLNFPQKTSAVTVQTSTPIWSEEAKDLNDQIYKYKTIDPNAAYGTRTAVYGYYNNAFALASSLGCLDPDPALCKPDQTAIGNVSNLIASMYANPPASFALYARDFLANAGLVKPVYAQGIGYVGLLPLLPAWKAMRNVSYVILIFVMVAIGFMVIFRMKIDPKTIISVQAALPKIVVTLIVVTFSYAIVGLLIDLMYVIIAMIVSVLGTGFMFGPEETLSAGYAYTQGDMWLLFGHIITGGYWAFTDLWKTTIGLTGITGTASLLFVVKTAVTSALAGVSLPAILALGFAPAILIVVIVGLGILFTWIRILLILLNSYIQILINLVLAPLILLGEAIPGKSTFGGWVMGMIANLVVFPVTIAILMFSRFIAKLSPETPLWSPPLTLPGGDAASFNGILSMGILLLAPTLIVSVKKMFSPKSQVPLTAGTLMSPLTGSVSTVTGAAGQFYYMQQIPVLKKLFGGDKPHG